MASYETEDLRNVAIIGHSGSGKRGRIVGSDQFGELNVIKAEVPLAE